jgi:hypothetical protein
MESRHKPKLKNLVYDRKLEKAKMDYNKMLKQLQPFLKKSSYYFSSTDGKWFDEASSSDSIPAHFLGQNSYYC